MRKFLCLICLYTITVNAFSQSESTLREYLTKNVKSLNPIEGVYDVEWYCRYITPFIDRIYGTYHATIIITKGNGENFNVYLCSGYGRKSGEYKIGSNITISQLGESNVYYFNYYTSKCRIYLTDNNMHFLAKLALDNESANILIPWMNIAPSVNIFPVYDCIKTYPTPSMY